MSKKIIIVGGVAGGATALARLRRLDESAEIILFEKGEFVSFANCGLPYYLGGVIKNRESIFVTNIESIKGKYNVDIRNFSEVTQIDREQKKVKVKNVKTGEEYYESYDKLLLSTGSYPFVPPMEGVEAENVFTLWNVADVDKIYNYINKYQPKSAVIAGGGFIGIEVAENLLEKGISVTLVEFSGQILPPLDKDMAKIAENHIQDKGIKLLLNTGVKSIQKNGKQVELSNGDIIDTDMTLLSIGVRPNTVLAKDAGLELNQRGGVIVDDFMQSSDRDIYAIGDMIEVTNKVNDLKTMIPLAGPANKQGRAVAANILDLKNETYEGSIGTGIAKVCDLTIASTGENEKSLISRGLKLCEDYGISIVHPMSHAGYYPGAKPMTIKLIYSNKDARVLGAQIVGYEGVDKRIDTIATTIHFKGSIYDLTKLELAYAPPYSSAKDPVNMAAYAASNSYEGLSEPISYEDFLASKDKFTLLDVREDMETAAGSIDNSLKIPLTKLRHRLSELDKTKTYVTFCAIGLRGYIAERILKQEGYKVRNLLGGYKTYNDINYVPGSKKALIQAEQDKLPQESSSALELDVCGLSCPGPIVSVAKEMDNLKEGQTLLVTATDPGFCNDIESWCINTGNTLVSKIDKKGIYNVVLKKGSSEDLPKPSCKQKEKTMIVFDGDLDKALAAFIIATGSAAMGNKVNMFFTFWGLNILRKSNPPIVKKDIMSKLFAIMMPKGSKKLTLSKMNFGGMGTKMMKDIMKKKGISSLEELIAQAQKAGVKMTACQMSMDVMGLKKEELIDGIEIGGVATMLNDNDNSNMNLFI
jgi:pyridine nucleotide-disulfide oxidoreductase family protein